MSPHEYDSRVIGADLGPLTFYTAATSDVTGAVLTLARLSGWWEAAPEITEATAHGTGDGTAPGMLRLGARTIELRGLIIGRDQGEVLEAREQINRTRSGTLVVDERGLGYAREATVRRVDRPEFVTLSPNISSYRLTLLADDPLRYASGSTPLMGGVQWFHNRGDQTAWPVIEIPGAHRAFDVVHPTGTWTIFDTPAGATRLVDLRNGDVWQAGVRLFQADMGPAPIVRPGGSQWVVTGIWGAGEMRAIVRRFEAWS